MILEIVIITLLKSLLYEDKVAQHIIIVKKKFLKCLRGRMI